MDWLMEALSVMSPHSSLQLHLIYLLISVFHLFYMMRQRSTVFTQMVAGFENSPERLVEIKNPSSIFIGRKTPDLIGPLF